MLCTHSCWVLRPVGCTCLHMWCMAATRGSCLQVHAHHIQRSCMRDGTSVHVHIQVLAKCIHMRLVVYVSVSRSSYSHLAFTIACIRICCCVHVGQGTCMRLVPMCPRSWFTPSAECNNVGMQRQCVSCTCLWVHGHPQRGVPRGVL